MLSATSPRFWIDQELNENLLVRLLSAPAGGPSSIIYISYIK